MSKTVLGLNIGHDRSAAIVQDGKLLGAIAQERIDRVKHSSGSFLAFDCINKLLDYLGMTIYDIDCIGFSGAELEDEFYMDYILKTLYSHYNCEYIPAYMIGHHQSHAEAAFSASGFEHALILIADGGGDYKGDLSEAESLFVGKDSIIQYVDGRFQSPIIRHMSDECNHIYPRMPRIIQKRELSISRKYEQITYLLGFGWGEAGKTMGLASYGKSLLKYNHTDIEGFRYHVYAKDILNDLYSLELLSGQTHLNYLSENGPNIARTIQDYTEDMFIHLIQEMMERYDEHNLCLGGGLFLNCLLNHKLLEQCSIKELFVFPACGDDGQAIGNAFAAYKRHFGPTKFKVSLPYLGLSYGDENIELVLKHKGLSYKHYTDKELSIKVAKYIAENKIVGFHRGRTEIGPRALCHRSILANPSNLEMKDILNKRVKHREYFRPFAPTVTYESQYEIFELKQDSPYMLLAANVKEDYRSKLPAITHIDNTARVQAVSAQQEPFVHSMLLELNKLIGVPVVLNTSFNVAGEPIVETPDDAVQTFLKTEIDVLVIGNFIVTK